MVKPSGETPEQADTRGGPYIEYEVREEVGTEAAQPLRGKEPESSLGSSALGGFNAIPTTLSLPQFELRYGQSISMLYTNTLLALAVYSRDTCPPRKTAIPLDSETKRSEREFVGDILLATSSETEKVHARRAYDILLSRIKDPLGLPKDIVRPVLYTVADALKTTPFTFCDDLFDCNGEKMKLRDMIAMVRFGAESLLATELEEQRILWIEKRTKNPRIETPSRNVGYDISKLDEGLFRRLCDPEYLSAAAAAYSIDGRTCGLSVKIIANLIRQARELHISGADKISLQPVT